MWSIAHYIVFYFSQINSLVTLFENEQIYCSISFCKLPQKHMLPMLFLRDPEILLCVCFATIDQQGCFSGNVFPVLERKGTSSDLWSAAQVFCFPISTWARMQLCMWQNNHLSHVYFYMMLISKQYMFWRLDHCLTICLKYKCWEGHCSVGDQLDLMQIGCPWYIQLDCCLKYAEMVGSITNPED